MIPRPVRGWLRQDGNAVRFVEITVNGPKTWSLAAALDPQVALAYGAAQDRAAQQIISWVADHATTRVGSRGPQVQVPVERIEAAPCGTTPHVRATRTGTCTCRSTPGSTWASCERAWRIIRGGRCAGPRRATAS